MNSLDTTDIIEGKFYPSYEIIFTFIFQLGMPLACDVFSALDTFLLTLPMFILTALAIHMFTRFPSPQFSDPSHPHNRQEMKVYGGRRSGNKYTPALNTR